MLLSRCVMLCAIWYHSYNLKNVKNTHGGVLLLVKFTKVNTPPWVFFTFLKLWTWYQFAQSTRCDLLTIKKGNLSLLI